MTPDAFKRPTGELNPDWFGSDLDALLQAAIAESAGETAEAQRAFVYARAYDTLVADLMSEPAQQRDREKGSTFTDAQLDYWRQQASAWRIRYDAAKAVVRAAVGVAL